MKFIVDPSPKKARLAASESGAVYRTTFERCLESVAEMQEDIAMEDNELIVPGGTYFITKPLNLSFSCPLTIHAKEGEKVIFDGGKKIDGITETTLGGKRCWTADIPEVKRGAWYFRSLYAGDNRATNAFLPHDGWFTVGSALDPEVTLDKRGYDGCRDAFYAKEGDFASFRNLEDVIVHSRHLYLDEHLFVKSFDPETNMVCFSNRANMPFFENDPKTGGRTYPCYRIENVFEGLCYEGEWYLDRTEGRLYYLPRDGETIENTPLYAPRLRQIACIHNSRGLVLEGITFRHTDWFLPQPGTDSRQGNVTYGKDTTPMFDGISDRTGNSCDAQAASYEHGSVEIADSTLCSIKNCTVEHTGGHGILVYRCSNIEVSECTVNDTGACGMWIGGDNGKNGNTNVLHHINVMHNTFSHGSKVFLSGEGIISFNGHHIRISHNDIFDYCNSGISVGSELNYSVGVNHDNIIEYNHIYNIGNGLLSDFGGIYTLGVQPGTIVHHNLIHDIQASVQSGWAIYPDEGSSHIVIEDNVCYDTFSEVFHQHYGRENIVRNNIFAFGGKGGIYLTRKEDHTGFTFEHNIVVTDGQPIFTGAAVSKVKSDMNIYWDVSGKPLTQAMSYRDEETWESLLVRKEQLNDMVSLFGTDPKFRDVTNRDFSLEDDSPAFALGFRKIDLTGVGR